MPPGAHCGEEPWDGSVTTAVRSPCLALRRSRGMCGILQEMTGDWRLLFANHYQAAARGISRRGFVLDD